MFADVYAMDIESGVDGFVRFAHLGIDGYAQQHMDMA
jgi:hypothetical protein